MDLEQKTFDIDGLQIKADPAGGPGEIEGYGAVFGNWDQQKDMIVPGAFTDTIPMLLKDGFMSWGHDLKSPPIASFSEVREDARGLYFRAQFHSSPEAQTARRVAQERIERGKSMGLSISYKVNGPQGQERTKEGRILKSLTVPEICLTPIPANRLANATGVKAVLSEATGYAPHADYTGTHSHAHPAMGSQGGDMSHTHSHTHQGDAMHDHSHAAAGKSVETEAEFDALTHDEKMALYYDYAGSPSTEAKAVWSSAYVKSLPNSAFACIDDSGRHYPHHSESGAVDPAHLKAALSRIGDPSNTQCGKAHLEAHAKAEGIGDQGKSDDPGDLKTFAQESYTALAAVDSFLDRARSLADLRQKAGRTISTSNRARLSDLRDQLMAACSAVDELMTMAEPPAKSVDALPEWMEMQRVIARSYGAAV